MKVLFQSAALCLPLRGGAVACRKETKAKAVATVGQDTMLLRDLAEANKTTANAGAVDNSLSTVRTSGGGSFPPLVEGASQSQPTNRVATQPLPGRSDLLNSGRRITAPTTANDAPAPTTVPLERSPASGPAKTSGDPCESPTATDQRYCLNRSIVANDADLN